MPYRLIIEGNSVYEIEEEFLQENECELQDERNQCDEGNLKKEKEWK